MDEEKGPSDLKALLRRRVTITLSEEDYHQLKRAADDECRAVAGVARRLLRPSLAAWESGRLEVSRLVKVLDELQSPNPSERDWDAEREAELSRISHSLREIEEAGNALRRIADQAAAARAAWRLARVVCLRPQARGADRRGPTPRRALRFRSWTDLSLEAGEPLGPGLHRA
jgi:hypothetical protein